MVHLEWMFSTFRYYKDTQFVCLPTDLPCLTTFATGVISESNASIPLLTLDDLGIPPWIGNPWKPPYIIIYP